MRYFIFELQDLGTAKFTNKDCLHCGLSSIALSFRRGGRRAAMRVSWVSLVLKLLRVDD
jgi:hypothetical protein